MESSGLEWQKYQQSGFPADVPVESVDQAQRPDIGQGGDRPTWSAPNANSVGGVLWVEPVGSLLRLS